MAKVLLGAGASVDATRPADGGAPLMAAAENGHVDMVTLLLGAGAEVGFFLTFSILVNRQ